MSTIQHQHLTAADISDDDIRDLHERGKNEGDSVACRMAMLAFTGEGIHRVKARAACAAMIEQWLAA